MPTCEHAGHYRGEKEPHVANKKLLVKVWTSMVVGKSGNCNRAYFEVMGEVMGEEETEVTGLVDAM